MSLVPGPVLSSAGQIIGSELNPASSCDSRPIGGGCINQAARVLFDKQPYFIKWNSAGLYPAMFTVEEKGLAMIRETNTIQVPQVIGSGEAEGYSFIVEEFIEAGIKGKNYWGIFGQSLAELHSHTQNHFGLDYDNY